LEVVAFTEPIEQPVLAVARQPRFKVVLLGQRQFAGHHAVERLQNLQAGCVLGQRHDEHGRREAGRVHRVERQQFVAGLQELRVHDLQLADEIIAEEGVQVLAVAFFLGHAGQFSQFHGPLGGDRHDRLAKHLGRLQRQESRMVDEALDSAGDAFHPIALFAVDLHGVDGDANLSHRGVDLVDHRADDVDALDGAAQLDQPFADDRDRHLPHGILRFRLAGGIGVRVGVGRRDFAAELFFPRAVFGGQGSLPLFVGRGFLFAERLDFGVSGRGAVAGRFGDAFQLGDDVVQVLDALFQIGLFLVRAFGRPIPHRRVGPLLVDGRTGRLIGRVRRECFRLLQFTFGFPRLLRRLDGPPFLLATLVRRLLGNLSRFVRQLLLHVDRGAVVRFDVAIDNLGHAMCIAEVVEAGDPRLDMVGRIEPVDDRSRFRVFGKRHVRPRGTGDPPRDHRLFGADGPEEFLRVVLRHRSPKEVADQACLHRKRVNIRRDVLVRQGDGIVGRIEFRQRGRRRLGIDAGLVAAVHQQKRLAQIRCGWHVDFVVESHLDPLESRVRRADREDTGARRAHADRSCRRFRAEDLPPQNGPSLDCVFAVGVDLNRREPPVLCGWIDSDAFDAQRNTVQGNDDAAVLQQTCIPSVRNPADNKTPVLGEINVAFFRQVLRIVAFPYQGGGRDLQLGADWCRLEVDTGCGVAVQTARC